MKKLFENNRAWAGGMVARESDFFLRLSRIQKPGYLWVGCSDSRVPANEIVGLRPGELFVHRNVANMVIHSDLNCLSVLQYAIEILEVSVIIVCGHYGCGGVRAAFDGSRFGLIDNWLRHVGDVKAKYSAELDGIKDSEKRFERLCELNVLEQAKNICQTTFVEEAWRKKKPLSVHAVIYDIRDGLLKELRAADSAKAFSS